MPYSHLKPVKIRWMWPHSMSAAYSTRNETPSTYFINGGPTCSWFSANTEAINFTHGLMCTSLCSWFLCLQWHVLVLMAKREQTVYLDAAKLPEMGWLDKKWNTCFEHLQFSPDKLLTYTIGSTTCSLRSALLSAEFAGYSLDILWMRIRRCQHSYVTRIGPLVCS